MCYISDYMAKYEKLKEEDVREWKSRIDLALEKNEEVRATTERLRRLANGDLTDWTPVFTTDDKYVNLFKEARRLDISSISARRPRVNVTPKNEKGVGIFRLWEEILNYHIRELDIKKTVDECLQDTYSDPYGVVKLGMDLQTQLDTTPPEVIEELKAQKQLLEQNLTSSEKKESEQLKEIKAKLKEIDQEISLSLEPNERIKREYAFVIRLDWSNFLWDSRAKNYFESEWQGSRILTTMKRIEADENFDKKAIKRLKEIMASPKMSDSEEIRTKFEDFQEYISQMDDFELNDEEMPVILYEVFARDDNDQLRIMVFAEGLDEMELRNDVWPIEMEGFPFVILGFEKENYKRYPRPQFQKMEDLAYEYNLVFNRIIKHVRTTKNLYMPEDPDMSSQELENVIEAVDGEILMKGIKPINQRPVFGDLYNLLALIKEEINNQMGISENLRGQTTKATATEVSNIANKEQLKKQVKQERIEEFYTLIMRKMMQIIKSQYDSEKVILITQDDGAFQEFNFTKQNIQGEFDLEIETGSTLPLNKEADKQNFLNFYSIVKNTIPNANDFELFKRLAEKFEVSSPERILPSPDQVPPDRENMQVVMMALGQVVGIPELQQIPPPEVNPQDNDVEHTEVHSVGLEQINMFGAVFGMLEPGVGEAFIEIAIQIMVQHIDGHQARIEKTGGNLNQATSQVLSNAGLSNLGGGNEAETFSSAVGQNGLQQEVTKPLAG